jgi:hypothetical protein
MATYIPNVPQYFPKLEHFTPDYKFLSNILDVKTDRYNTNYKALNDLYSKVVYGDLSRSDTQDIRNQYATDLSAKLEKVSGSDLSVMQNVEAAKGLFKPFFEEDIIVKDMVTTQKYKTDMQYANMLQNSPSQEQRKLYWQTGVEKMQYEMEDFINATEEEALKMSAPKYVPNADLYRRAKDYMKSQDYNVKITEPSKDGMWMISRKNGDLITAKALQDAQRELKDDPRVVNAYRADAFVRSRRFASKGLEAGQFASIKDGQAAWANEQIGRVQQFIAAKNVKLEDDLKKQRSTIVSWENYSKQYGVIPGSDESKVMSETNSKYQATIDALNGNKNELANSMMDDNQSLNSRLNKAYGLLMHYNMEDDLQAAAISYASMDKEIEFKASDYGKKKVQFQYDVAKIQMQAQIKENLEKIKHANKLKEIDYELGAENQKNPLENLLGGMNIEYGLSGTTSGLANEDGELPEDFDFLAYQDKVKGKALQGVLQEELTLALDAYRQINPSNNGKYNIKGFTGTLQEIKKQMKNHPEVVEGLFTEMAGYFKGASISGGSLADGAGPKFAADLDGRLYQDMAEKFRSTVGKRRQIDAASAQLYQTANENFIKALTIPQTKDQEGIIKAYEQGLPKIFTTINKGKRSEGIDILSREEYIEKVIQYAKQQEVNIDNIDLSDNVGSLGYREYVAEDFGNPLMGGQQIGGAASSLLGTLGSYGLVGGGSPLPSRYKKAFDNTIAKMQAGELYDMQSNIVNATLNGSLNRFAATSLEEGVPYTPLYKEYDVAQALKGIDPSLMNSGEISSNPTYSAILDPLNPSDDAMSLFESFYNQVNQTPQQDIYLYSGKVGESELTKDAMGEGWYNPIAWFRGSYDDIDEVVGDREMGDGTVAKRLIDLYFQDLNRMQVKGATKSDYPGAVLTYQPHIQSDPEKLESEYSQASITFDTDWLDQYTKTGGLLEGKNIEDYKTASYLVKKSSDINPRKFGEYNFSNIASTISTSEDAQYYEPVIRGGGVRVFQDASGNYIAETQPVVWDPETLNYSVAGSLSKNLGPDRYALDNEVQKIIEGLYLVANNNYGNEMNAKRSQK